MPLESHRTGKYVFKTYTGIPETLFFFLWKSLRAKKTGTIYYQY